MVVWTTIAATPLNSVVNPVILTVTTCRKLYKEREKAETGAVVCPALVVNDEIDEFLNFFLNCFKIVDMFAQ